MANNMFLPFYFTAAADTKQTFCIKHAISSAFERRMRYLVRLRSHKVTLNLCFCPPATTLTSRHHESARVTASYRLWEVQLGRSASQPPFDESTCPAPAELKFAQACIVAKGLLGNCRMSCQNNDVLHVQRMQDAGQNSTV